MSEQAVELTNEEVANIGQGLAEHWLSMNYCQSANPFKSSVDKIVLEEFNLWRDEFYTKLHKVLAKKEQTEFYALAYESQDGQTINFTSGYRIGANLPLKDFAQASEDIGFAINGLEFHLCDASLSWTIGTTVDIQFLAGDSAFFKTYFADPAEEKAAVGNFLKFIAPDHILPEFQKMKDYLRP